jgi:OTU-like cysteine protease
MSDQIMKKLGIKVSAEELRRQSVLYMMEHASRLRQFVSTNWEEYVSRMSKSTTYGDHITLCAIANICKIHIHVVSLLGDTVLVSPDESDSTNAVPTNSAAMFYVGHLPENDCDRSKGHYLSLSPTNEWAQQNAGMVFPAARPLADLPDTDVNNDSGDSAEKILTTSLSNQSHEGKLLSVVIVNNILNLFISVAGNRIATLSSHF